MFRKIIHPSVEREVSPQFFELMPVEQVDEHGVIRVHMEKVPLDKISQQQLPDEITLQRIIDSGEMITPQSLEVIQTTDPYTRQTIGEDKAYDIMSEYNRNQPEPNLEPKPEPKPTVS